MKRFALATLSTIALGLTLTSGADAIRTVNFASLSSHLTATEAIQIAATPGQFVTVEQDHPTEGTASFITENGQTYLVFDEAFTTARGPAVEVVLYTADEVPINLENDADNEYVTIAPLQSFDGAQRYLVPADIDVDAYDAVAIWCRQFDVTFGYAPL